MNRKIYLLMLAGLIFPVCICAQNPARQEPVDTSFITGLAFTRFFTKSNLAFYTSPLNNNLYAYFTYRHLWIKPSIALSYGWGSRTSYSEREDLITSLLLAKNGYARINQTESI